MHSTSFCGKDGVGVLVSEEFVDKVVEVKHE